MLLVTSMKICPINLSSLIWGCQKQLRGRPRGCGGWEVSADSFPHSYTLLPLCMRISAHSAVHSQALELEEPRGMEGAAAVEREERDTPVSWKPPESTHCGGLAPANRMLQCPDLQSSPPSRIHLWAPSWVWSQRGGEHPGPSSLCQAWRT